MIMIGVVSLSKQEFEISFGELDRIKRRIWQLVAFKQTSKQDCRAFIDLVRVGLTQARPNNVPSVPKKELCNAK